MKARFCLPLLVVCLIPCANLSATGSESARQPSTGVTAVSSAEDAATTSTNSEYPIPGPLRSFLRMAGISQQIPLDEVLPSLSWSVETQGFEGLTRPTEYLVLLRRYVVQAKELSELAGDQGAIRVSNCDE